MLAVLGRNLPIKIIVLTLFASSQSHGQGTIQITFDGPPPQPPGTAFLIQQYNEADMSFVPLPGSIGFARSGGGRVEFADNDTPYLQAGLGMSLMFSFINGTIFNLISVDLAEFSITATNSTVPFVGFRRDGSTVMTNFTIDGVIDGPGQLPDFETFFFGPEFSNLTRVEISTFGWSLDNLVVAVPEPSALSLLGGGVLLLAWVVKRRKPPKASE